MNSHFLNKKTSTLSKFTEPWQYANICLKCQISLHAEFKNFLSSVAEIHLLTEHKDLPYTPQNHSSLIIFINITYWCQMKLYSKFQVLTMF